MFKLENLKIQELKKPINSLATQYLMCFTALKNNGGVPMNRNNTASKGFMYVSKINTEKEELYEFCKKYDIPYHIINFKGKDGNQIKNERKELFNTQDGCHFNTNENIKFDIENPKDDFQKAGILFCDNFNEMAGNWQTMFNFHNIVLADDGVKGEFQFPPYWMYVAFTSSLKDKGGETIPAKILSDFIIYDDEGNVITN